MTIVTMSTALYRVTSSKFNLVYLNRQTGPSSWAPLAAIADTGNVLWQADLTFAIADLETFIAFRRFVMKLRGGRNLARLTDPMMLAPPQAQQPRGAGGVTSTVNVATAAAAGAETVTLKNLQPSEPIALQAGDLIGIGENLHVVEDDAASDSDGEANIVIQPPLRKGVAVDDAVNLSAPTGLFRLIGGAQDLALDLALIGQAVTLSFTEYPDAA